MPRICQRSNEPSPSTEASEKKHVRHKSKLANGSRQAAGIEDGIMDDIEMPCASTSGRFFMISLPKQSVYVLSHGSCW